MALTYLLDTNVVSELEVESKHPHLEDKVLRFQNHVAISAVSWHELWYGYHQVSDPKRKEKIGDLLNWAVTLMPILPYGDEAAEWFAQERSRLTKIGRTPSYPDGQIAAIAAVNNLIVVTRNVKDFADFHDIEIENWFEET